MKPKLSVVIPALNEEENLKATIETVKKAAELHSLSIETIVVNDGSVDGTRAIADESADKVIHHKSTLGMGKSYFEGVKAASGEYVIMIPGDNEIEESSVQSLLGEVGSSDIVTTFIGNKEVRSLKRRMLSKGFSGLIYLISGIYLRSFSGTTIYPVDLIRKYNFRANGFGYNAEILVALVRNGASCKEVPIRIKPQHGRHSRAFSVGNYIDVGTTLLRFAAQRFFKSVRL